jgi:tRNA modification GTPase
MVSAFAPGDTIFALSSAPGRAGIAVVRLSGKLAHEAARRLTGRENLVPRRAIVCSLKSRDGELIDQGLVLFFPTPTSYTGEDVVELHVHGGRAVLERLFSGLSELGLRAAEPGEFTRRAVHNGKLDITRAEAVADLIDAETEAQRQQALGQYDGGLFRLYESWAVRLTASVAWAEAAIDFSDEELPDDLLARSRDEAGRLETEVARHLADGRRGELLREGLQLTVIGPPNAGKSSLINALAQRDVAIVSETAGTTRDVIEVRLDLGGYPVIVADTAGLRATTEAIESEGVHRALARAEAADLVLLLLDGTEPGGFDVSRETQRAPDLVVWNKADLAWPERPAGLRLSLKTGEGLDAVIAAITKAVQIRLEAPREVPLLTRARHRAALGEASDALRRARSTKSPELCAEDLRLALRAIGRITGRVDIEDVLDVIFRDFCIGK